MEEEKKKTVFRMKKISVSSESKDDLMNVLGGEKFIKGDVMQKKNFASDILKIKEKLQKSLVMDTNILFSMTNKTNEEQESGKLESIEKVIKESFDLLKRYLKVDFMAYASIIEMHNLFKDGNFNFFYSNGESPTKINPRNLEDSMLQTENCFLETGNSLSYFKDSGLSGVLDMVYAFKGYTGDTTGYLLLDGLSEETKKILENIISIFYRELFHVFLERQNIILGQKLRKSELDPLIGLKRRDALMNKCREIFERNSRIYEDEDFDIKLDKKMINSTVTILDIDDFKRVNDEYGHLVGDLVIKKIVKVCKQNSRQADKWTWYRYGGEEFVGIFDSIPIDGAMSCLDRIQDADKGITLSDRDDNKRISVTLSLGATSITSEEMYFYSYINTMLFKEIRGNNGGLSNKELMKEVIARLQDIKDSLSSFDVAKEIDIDDFYNSIVLAIENIKNIDDFYGQEIIDYTQNIIKDFLINNAIKRADDALYHSKKTGKDRITVY